MTQPQALPSDSIQKLASRFRSYRSLLYTVGLLAFLAIGGLFFFERYQRRSNSLAQVEMFQAVYYFEKDDFDKALHGDEVWPGLLEVAKTYPFTQAANLANFYIGVSYLRQQAYDKAIQHLSRVWFKGCLLQARTWALMGDAYTEQANYQKATVYYSKAVNYRPNKAFTPTYLSKAALAYEASGDLRAALDCYQRIVQKFSGVSQYGMAVKHVARLKTLLQSSS